jgi:hypothetical protein
LLRAASVEEHPGVRDEIAAALEPQPHRPRSTNGRS